LYVNTFTFVYTYDATKCKVGRIDWLAHTLIAYTITTRRPTSTHAHTHKHTHTNSLFLTHKCTRTHTPRIRHSRIKIFITICVLAHTHREYENTTLCHNINTFCLYVFICIRVSLHTYKVINIFIREKTHTENTSGFIR